MLRQQEAAATSSAWQILQLAPTSTPGGHWHALESLALADQTWLSSGRMVMPSFACTIYGPQGHGLPGLKVSGEVIQRCR